MPRLAPYRLGQHRRDQSERNLVALLNFARQTGVCIIRCFGGTLPPSRLATISIGCRRSRDCVALAYVEGLFDGAPCSPLPPVARRKPLVVLGGATEAAPGGRAHVALRPTTRCRGVCRRWCHPLFDGGEAFDAAAPRKLSPLPKAQLCRVTTSRMGVLLDAIAETEG